MANNGQAAAAAQLNNIFGNGLNQRNAAAKADAAQLQATPAPNPNATVPATAPSNPGAAAQPDDQIPAVPSTVSEGINLSSSGDITPQTNVLDQYASYTYNLAWYLVTPTQYKVFANTLKPDTNQWNLLIQSGGAGPQKTASGATSIPGSITGSPTTQPIATTGRNKYFSLDYYIDNLTITSAITGKGTGYAHNATELEFEVTEPNGITLIDNLKAAVYTTYKKDDPSAEVLYNKATFCLVIRFYGYDAQGNLITKVGRGTSINGTASPSDPSAIVVKYYPFTITELKYTIANKQIVYHIKGATIKDQFAAGTAYGVVNQEIELVGKTLGDILSGAGTTTAPAEDGRGSSTQSVSNGPANPSPAADPKFNAYNDAGY
jgi:hypothetical protein